MNFAEQLKAQIDIVRTVGEYVRLRKVGARYVGLCPFHTEKTPSFNVNPALGIFVCFGCGAKGDVFRFVQELEQLTFPETLKLLADRNGIPMPSRHERSDADTELREAVFAIHEAAAKAFQEQLYGSSGGEVRNYLATRGLSQSTVEHFGLGYADRSGQDLLRRLRGRYSAQQLEASGLFGKREQDGSLYDRFRGRLIFPIHNESGKVIAFGGRALRPEDEPKYLNSPETAIYKKKHVLYNLHRAKQVIRKAERAVLVEGYMDAIGVYAAGVQNVIASCGTALTEEQVRAIKRHSENIIVNFDPDTAGANAAERSIQMLLGERMHVRILELEAGLDPDEYIRTRGADRYIQCCEKATGYFIWLADRARKSHDMGSAEGRMAGLQSLLLPAIRRISDRLERAAIASEVAEYLGVDRNIVLNEFRRTPSPAAGSEKAIQPGIPAAERVLLRSLISDQDVREVLMPVLRTSAAVRKFYIWPVLEVFLQVFTDQPDASFMQFEAQLAEPLKPILLAATLSDSSEEVFTHEQALAYARLLESEDRKLEIEVLRTRLKQAERSGDTAQAFQLMETLDGLQRGQRR